MNAYIEANALTFFCVGLLLFAAALFILRLAQDSLDGAKDFLARVKAQLQAGDCSCAGSFYGVDLDEDDLCNVCGGRP